MRLLMTRLPRAGKSLKSASFPFPAAESFVIWEGAVGSQEISPCPHPGHHPAAPCVRLPPSVCSPSSDMHTYMYIHLFGTGLMIRPKTENLDVIVNVSDTESWDQHVQKLNKFLERE